MDLVLGGKLQEIYDKLEEVNNFISSTLTNEEKGKYEEVINDIEEITQKKDLSMKMSVFLYTNLLGEFVLKSIKRGKIINN